MYRWVAFDHGIQIHEEYADTYREAFEDAKNYGFAFEIYNHNGKRVW